MFDDLAYYYHENVLQSFVDYRNICNDDTFGRSRDLRAALTAASALFHLREHLPSGAISRTEVERLCPDYALLGDIANASKHKFLNGKTPHGAPLIANAENLSERLILIEYEDEAGTYFYNQKTVIVRLTDGSERNLLEVLTNVINFWENYLLSMDVLSTARVFTYDNNIRFRSRQECESSCLNLEMVQGLRFNQHMQLLRYNKTSGKVEPVDLTDSTVEMHIYKPKVNIELSLTHKASGQTYKTEIALTEEEHLLLYQMSSDEERKTYVNNLPAAKSALKKLAAEAGLFNGLPKDDA